MQAYELKGLLKIPANIWHSFRYLDFFLPGFYIYVFATLKLKSPVLLKYMSKESDGWNVL